MPLKLTTSSVKNIIESYGCKMLSSYEGATSPILMECKCGKTMLRSITAFKGSKYKNCNQCINDELSKKFRSDFVKIKKYISDSGSELIGSFTNTRNPINIKCRCGNIYVTNFQNYKTSKSKTCSYCLNKGNNDYINNKRFSFEYVKKYIESFECKLLSSEYKNNRSHISISCKCGEIWNVAFESFKNSKYKSCKICTSKITAKKISGEKSHMFGKKGELHHNYNKNFVWKKFKKDYATKEYYDLRESVIVRDNNTCKKCGFIAKYKTEKSRFNMHHLFNKSQYPKWFFRKSNLITLCGECHVNFHKIFGFKNNTPKQMKIYLAEGN